MPAKNRLRQDLSDFVAHAGALELRKSLARDADIRGLPQTG
jgi:hypothetical protein